VQVIRYQYQLPTQSRSTSIWQSLIESGTDLLQYIKDEEAQYKFTSRPLILLAQGLGGIVLKKVRHTSTLTKLTNGRPFAHCTSKTTMSLIGQCSMPSPLSSFLGPRILSWTMAVSTRGDSYPIFYYSRL
jgi:hypothetical protein